MADWGGAAVVLAGSIPYSVALTIAAVRARASQRWPRVIGVLDRSEMLIGPAGSSRRPEGLTKAPDIRYEYRVRGGVYGGWRLRFGPAMLLPAEHWIHDHAKGAPVSIAYDPRRPEMSVLEPGVSTVLAISLVIALLLVGVGLWWLVVSLRG